MFSPIDIARMEEGRQAIGVAEISDESERIAGGTMCFGGKGSWMNQGQGIGLAGPVSEEELDCFVEFYTSRGVEPKMEVCPFADDSLVEGLSKRNFTLLEFESVLFRESGRDEDLSELMPHPSPEGLEILEVDRCDSQQVETFVEVTCRGFAPKEEDISKSLKVGIRRAVRHPRSHSFLAMIEGEPAGGGGMEVTKEVSCLFGASVLPPYRRRGIQAALILRRLQQAQSEGSLLVAIHSKPGIPTERNAMRLGFNVAYTKAIMRMSGPGLSPSP